jgi:hypothetical protein
MFPCAISGFPIIMARLVHSEVGSDQNSHQAPRALAGCILSPPVVVQGYRLLVISERRHSGVPRLCEANSFQFSKQEK